MSGRSRAAGLPSGPGPRSRSAARSADRDRDRGGRSEYDSDGGASSRSARRVRPQGRADPRPPPVPRHNPTSSDDRRSDSTYRSDSTTSSGSSFLDRIKQGTGYASSRTSLEDEAPQKPRSMRSRPAREESPDEETPLKPLLSAENEAPPPGDGYNIWSKVTSAASSLSVNVGKAWAANITTHTGEDTPAGQESRLTRAMKAYHVEKARDPSDLPAWLFDEQERRRPAPAAAPSSRSRRRDDDEYDVVETTRAEPPPSRGLA
ncbi:hypothetical protein C8J57DRAFT_1663184 [Mycena rebaudengoi]|nr:hypothetical protein C8J57DRAFT_1663184 [Mycena rebaudengoi]